MALSVLWSMHLERSWTIGYRGSQLNISGANLYWTAESRLTGAHNRCLQRDERSFSFHASVRLSVCLSVPLYKLNLPQFLTYRLEILYVGSKYVSLVIVYVFIQIKTFFEFFSYIVKFQVCSNALFDSSFLSSRQVELKTP